jgi:hypothetical protein
MKQYSNSPRKPMMYGGDSRKKMSTGGNAMANAETQSRVATGQATSKDKAAMQRQRRENLQREIKQAKEDGDNAAIQRFKKASTSPTGDGPIIKGILQNMGMAERAPAPQETSGMMYGGKAKKK